MLGDDGISGNFDSFGYLCQEITKFLTGWIQLAISTFLIAGLRKWVVGFGTFNYNPAWEFWSSFL